MPTFERSNGSEGQPWSVTRARTFRDCRRRYYYRYQLAPLARRPEPPSLAVQAERMKDLLGLETWSGDVVHRTLEAALFRWRAGRPFSEEDAVAHAHGLLSRGFRDSRAYWSANPEEFPRRPSLLDLHFYDVELPRERATRLKESVTGAVRSFCRSELADRIRAVDPRQDWLPIDRNAAARLEGGLVILVKPDFAFRDGGWLRILDWKTGKPDPFWESVQVACYSLYARQKWNAAPEAVLPQIVHLLPEFQISEVECSSDAMASVALVVRESWEEMETARAGEATPPIERFPCCDDPGRCRWCSFRGICEGAERARAG